jgi:hypothetical protein
LLHAVKIDGMPGRIRQRFWMLTPSVLPTLAQDTMTCADNLENPVTEPQFWTSPVA